MATSLPRPSKRYEMASDTRLQELRAQALRAMVKALKDRGPDTPVLEVMHDVPTISANAKLDVALRSLMQRGQPVIGVTGSDEKLVGLLTVENLGEMMMIHSARPEPGSAPSPWGRPGR